MLLCAMAPKTKSPATISMEELADSAKRASRKANKQAREAGIEVAGIDLPEVVAKKASAKSVA